MFEEFQKLMGPVMSQLIKQSEEDAAYHDRKAKRFRSNAKLLRNLKPIFAEMLKPPKPFRPKPLSKRRIAELRKQGIIPPAIPFAAAR